MKQALAIRQGTFRRHIADVTDFPSSIVRSRADIDDWFMTKTGANPADFSMTGGVDIFTGTNANETIIANEYDFIGAGDLIDMGSGNDTLVIVNDAGLNAAPILVFDAIDLMVL